MPHVCGSTRRTICAGSAVGAAGAVLVCGVFTSYPSLGSRTITMKMMSSTRTTSTSGVTLISDCSPALEPFPLNPMASASLPLVARPLRDQRDPVEAGLLDREHRLPYL